MATAPRAAVVRPCRRNCSRHASAGSASSLLPAAVILAGVLIVVAFGFIISRAVRDDDQDGAAAGAAARGGECPPTRPTSSRSRCPAPPTRPARRRPHRPRRARPAPSRRRAPRSGRRRSRARSSVARAGVPSRVDLSAEGTRDWVHWGEQSTFSLGTPVERRLRDPGGSRPPRRASGTASARSGSAGTAAHRWPTRDGTPTGIRTCGKGNGFTISAPASTDDPHAAALRGRPRGPRQAHREAVDRRRRPGPARSRNAATTWTPPSSW